MPAQAEVITAGGFRDTMGTIGALLLRYGMVVVLVVMVLTTVVLDPQFLDRQNLQNLALQWAPVGLMAVGMTYVIISGGFDLSVGGIYAVGAVLYAAVAQENNTMIAIVVTLLAGALIGVVNGLVITRLDVNPFVATLGMGFVLRGLALVTTSAAPILVFRDSFTTLGAGRFLGIPIPVLILIVSLIAGGLVLSRTIYGRYVYAVGGGEEAARLSGIPTNRVKASVYVMTGVGAALAGMIIASRLGSGQADIGAYLELDVITVVVVGGTALAGGEGAMWRTTVGITILAVLGNSFDRLQVNPFWQLVIKGLIIILAIAADSYSRRKFAGGGGIRLRRTSGAQ